MNKNSGHIFRIVAGIYLIYLGVKILMDVTRKQPSNMVFMAVMSVIYSDRCSLCRHSTEKDAWNFFQEKRADAGYRIVGYRRSESSVPVFF